MATIEEQLKQLAKDVKTFGVEQVKGNRDLKELVEWKHSTTRTAAELQVSIDNLTSCIQALEDTFFKPPPMVPPREEEGQAVSHGKKLLH
jgi:predicted  nucleic acid-binding Zn-ribbon protein